MKKEFCLGAVMLLTFVCPELAQRGLCAREHAVPIKATAFGVTQHSFDILIVPIVVLVSRHLENVPESGANVGRTPPPL